MAKSNVGRSSRSVYKHWVLDTHLGKIVGALSTGKTPARANPLLCVDLCAGDGGSADEYDQSSPAIIHKHCEWLASRDGGRYSAQSIFYEKSEFTFGKLVSRLSDWPTHERHRRDVIRGDAKEFSFSKQLPNQAVFVNCDPNSVSDLPNAEFAERLAAQLTPTTTMAVTLGCNVGGLKRMPLEDRKPWREFVEIMLRAMPSWHDALLVEICGDKSQWAYLTRLPAKWADEQKAALQRAGDKLKGDFPRGVAVFSRRLDRSRFDDLMDRLLYTQKELANV
jgi:hypothetical protein